MLIAGLGERERFGAEQARVAAASARRARRSWARCRSLGGARGRRCGGGAGRGHASEAVLVRPLQVAVRRRRRERRRRVARDHGRGRSAEEVELGQVAAAPPTRHATSRTCRPTWPRRPSSRSAPPRSPTVRVTSRWSCSTARRSWRAAWAPSPRSRRAATSEPRLIVLRYRPDGARGPHLGFVGKAVTFDTADLDQALGEDAGHEVRHVRRRRGHRIDGRDRRAGLCR